MAFEFTTGPVSQKGQAEAAPNTGTTVEAPQEAQGQAQETPPIETQDSGQSATQTPQQPTQAPAEDSFFDPSTLSDELKPAYKQMQAQFTKKMQAIRDQRQKVEAYDAFMQNPEEQIQRLAQQYGYNLQKGQQQQTQAPQQGGPIPDDWQPQTWQEVMNVATQVAQQQIMQQLAPVLQPLYQTVESITSKNIETQLDQVDPNWRMYEDDIKANMKEHPTLIKSQEGILKLYRISVPWEQQTAHAVQTAMKKVETKAQAAKMQGKSTSHTSGVPARKVSSFDDAVALAKQQLGNQGRY